MPYTFYIFTPQIQEIGLPVREVHQSVTEYTAGNLPKVTDCCVGEQEIFRYEPML